MNGEVVSTSTNDQLQSGFSAMDVDDLTGDGIMTIAKSRRQGQFPLLRLSTELRLHIFSFLLPDLETIYPVYRGKSHFPPGSRTKSHGWAQYRHDSSPGDMAIMRSNRQIYDETSHYLYNRSTIVVSIRDDGVSLLANHWGCGRITGSSLRNIPFHKFKLVWLHIEAASDLRRHLVHVRRNLLDLCMAFCQTEPPKCLRVDLFDACHRDALDSLESESTHVQGGVKMVTKGIESLIDGPSGCTKKRAERQIWRAANSTGTSLVATDVEATLQPLKLLRGAQTCQIFLNPHLQSDKSLVALTALYEEMIRSKRDIPLTDLTSVHDVSEELYRSAALDHCESFVLFHHEGAKRMEHLLWQTKKWHKLPCAPIDECLSYWDGYESYIMSDDEA